MSCGGFAHGYQPRATDGLADRLADQLPKTSLYLTRSPRESDKQIGGAIQRRRVSSPRVSKGVTAKRVSPKRMSPKRMSPKRVTAKRMSPKCVTAHVSYPFLLSRQ
jgi:hypothetical protein